MNPADDSRRRAPFSDHEVATALLKPEFNMLLDQVLVDRSTVVLHFQTPIAELLLRQTPDHSAEQHCSAPPESPVPYALVREGNYWTVTFKGRRCHLRATNGVAHFAELLRHPNEYIPALALAALLDTVTEGECDPQADRVWDSALSTAQSGLPTLDARTPVLYRLRLEALDADADRARILGDTSALERCASERTAILKQLAAGLDHKGRPRLTHDGAERARQNVQKAVKAAIKKIAAEDPALGEHLRSCIDTGTQCRYRPVSPIPWTFS